MSNLVEAPEMEPPRPNTLHSGELPDPIQSGETLNEHPQRHPDARDQAYVHRVTSLPWMPPRRLTSYYETNTVRRSETSHRPAPVLRCLALLTGVLLLAGACKSSGRTTSSTNPGPSSPVTEATLAPGDVRFLIARQNLIENITLSGQERKLVQLDDKVNIFDLALSPDGTQLAFVVELPASTDDQGKLDFGTDLYVSGADGSNPQVVLKHKNAGDYFQAPAWLNESTLIVGFYGVDPNDGSFSRIESFDRTTGNRELVLDSARMGNLTPDRKAVIYTAIDPDTRVERLEIADLSALQQPRILVDHNSGLGLFSAVVSSPDSSQIAFAAVDLATTSSLPDANGVHLISTTTHPFAQDVWLVNPDGTGLHRVAEIAENMPSVTWSGDGSFIYALGPGFLWRLDPVTGEELQQPGERGSIIWLDGA
jgi:hypothetical protein